MSMKTANSPRKIYTRNGVIHVLQSGRSFAPSRGETRFDMDVPVIVTPLESDGGRARVEVVQARKGKPSIKEVWRSTNVPTNPRS